MCFKFLYFTQRAFACTELAVKFDVLAPYFIPCASREQKEIMTTNSDFPELPPEELPAGSDVNDTPSGVVNSDDLDSSLMSGFSNLQIGNGDCPQTFSPIGSERTSPEQGTLQKSQGFCV